MLHLFKSKHFSKMTLIGVSYGMGIATISAFNSNEFEKGLLNLQPKRAFETNNQNTINANLKPRESIFQFQARPLIPHFPR